ncbi:MAG: methyltransferase [Bacteroidota bacterium]
MSEFVFRHFTVIQEQSAMKIGTDSVLLGCLCDVKKVSSVLDIGSGTGILALMLAQRCHANIDAVEMDEPAAREAGQNFRNSPWSERLNLYHQSIQQFAEEKQGQYDLIISNPPYYKAGNNLQIEDEQRSKARHDKGLPFEELISSVLKLLQPTGSFWLILPVNEAADFKGLVKDELHLVKQINLVPKPGKAANRLVMQFTYEEQQLVEEDFTVYNADNTPSERYKQAARDFYTGAQFKPDNV